MNEIMTREQFVYIEKLYHYTSFTSAIKIIGSDKLLFGKLNRMNDIQESYRKIFHHEGIDEENIRLELEKYQQLSLTRDYAPRRGFDIPAMWGHYAEKGEGICLVFDKAKLESCLSDEIKKGEITYKDDYDGDILIADGQKENLSQLFNEKYKELFFVKSSDWSYEQEFRLLVRTNNNDRYVLDFKDCLIGIILNFSGADKEKKESMFNSVEKNIVDKIKAPNVKIFDYARWDKSPTLTGEDGADWSCLNRYSGCDLDTTMGKHKIEE